MAIYSQKRELDSLKNAVSRVDDDIEKAKLLNAISEKYKATNPSLMLEYANKALQLSQKIRFKLEEGTAYLNIGNAHVISGNYGKALENFSLAQSVFENEMATDASSVLKIKKGLIKSYGSIGVVFTEQSNYQKALQFYIKALQISEKINDTSTSGKLYNNIGIIYKSQNEDFKALENFLKALKIQEKRKDKNIGITYTNIANNYLKTNDLIKSFDYFALAKKSIDSHPDYRTLGEWYNSVGLFYQANNQLEKAFENWKLALETFSKTDNKFGLADTYLLISKLYLEQKKPVKAIENATKALNLSKEMGTLESQVHAQKLLSDSYSLENNLDKALFHFRLYSLAKDSLNDENSIRKSTEMAMNFDFEKREVIQKEALEKKELLLQEQSKQSKMQLFFAVIFGLLLFGIGFLIYSRIQLRKTLTLQKELAEYEQKALHLQMNPHFVFNCLGSISSFIVNNGTDSAIRYLAKFSKLMRLTLEYSKESLIPIDKEIESLQNYLELEQLRFNNRFSFAINKANDIEDDVALPPLLLQPFVENAIIHGIIPSKKEGRIEIDFTTDTDFLICTITDNGVGFNHSKKAKENTVVVHKSLALDITKKRLQMIESTTTQKADFIIEEINKNEITIGTKVILKLPLQYF